MTTSVNEMVEYHRDVAELYVDAAKRYPNATIQYIGNQTVVYNQGGVTEDRIMVVGDKLIAYERIEWPGGWIPAVGSMWHQHTVALALEHLRETAPQSYAGLIEWMRR